MGPHAFKSWSTDQTIIALSSAEAELYSLLKGASQALGLQSMAQDFGDSLNVGLYSDASAAIAISQRKGLGKVRHISTQYLWLQERVLNKQIALHNVVGTNNPAHISTKPINAETRHKHLQFGNLTTTDGRANQARQV